jgi:hypothetical protein
MIALLKELAAHTVAYYVNESEWTNEELDKSLPLECIDAIKKFYKYKGNEQDGLQEAAKKGRLDLIKLFERPNTTWKTALYNAVEGGHLKIVKYCESKGANTDWNVALYLADLYGHKEIVKYCESKGANNFDSWLFQKN